MALIGTATPQSLQSNQCLLKGGRQRTKSLPNSQGASFQKVSLSLSLCLCVYLWSNSNSNSNWCLLLASLPLWVPRHWLACWSPHGISCNFKQCFMVLLSWKTCHALRASKQAFLSRTCNFWPSAWCSTPKSKHKVEGIKMDYGWKNYFI